MRPRSPAPRGCGSCRSAGSGRRRRPGGHPRLPVVAAEPVRRRPRSTRPGAAIAAGRAHGVRCAHARPPLYDQDVPASSSRRSRSGSVSSPPTWTTTSSPATSRSPGDQSRGPTSWPRPPRRPGSRPSWQTRSGRARDPLDRLGRQPVMWLAVAAAVDAGPPRGRRLPGPGVTDFVRRAATWAGARPAARCAATGRPGLPSGCRDDVRRDVLGLLQPGRFPAGAGRRRRGRSPSASTARPVTRYRAPRGSRGARRAALLG